MGYSMRKNAGVFEQRSGALGRYCKKRREPSRTDVSTSGARSALADIQVVKTETEQRLRIILDLQARVSKQALAIADVIEKLNTSRQRLQARLFYPGAPPLWRVWPVSSAESIGTVLSRSIARSYESLSNFVFLRKGSVARLLVWFVIAVAVMRWLGRANLRSQSSDHAVEQLRYVLRRPVSLAVLIISPVAFLLTPRVQINAVLALSLILYSRSRACFRFTRRLRVFSTSWLVSTPRMGWSVYSTSRWV